MRLFLYANTSHGKEVLEKWCGELLEQCTQGSKEQITRFYEPAVGAEDRPARKALGKHLAEMVESQEPEWLVVPDLAEISTSLKHLAALAETVVAKNLYLFAVKENVVVGPGDLPPWIFSVSVKPLVIPVEAIKALSSFENSVRRTRTGALAADARSRGEAWGRPPKISKVAVKEMIKAGHTPVQVAEKLNVGISTIYRVLAEKGEGYK